MNKIKCIIAAGAFKNKYKNVVYNKVKLPLAYVAIARVSSLRHNRKEEESKNVSSYFISRKSWAEHLELYSRLNK